MDTTPGFLGPGWAFPVRTVRETREIELSEGKEDIEQAIRILLGTPRGSRVMRPDFGCGIHELVFQPMNASTLGEIEQSIREAIVRYEPRVTLEELVVRPSEKDPRGQLDIDVKYRIRATNSPGNRTYPFYLQERA